jgi:hypothetical protein
MDRIVIPNKATRTRLPLTDLAMGAPLASRLLLGATLPGQFVAAASIGYYAGSAAKDWYRRRGVRPIDFQAAFGADWDTLAPQPAEARLWEIKLLGHALNEGFVAKGPGRDALARRINDRLTAYIAAITDQEVVTSSEIRSFSMARYLVPGALGSCDPISGDIAIFVDEGVLLPHVIAHELCHRKGYLKELHAQALAFLALRTSGDPVLVQAARVERLHRQLRVHQRSSNQPLYPRQLLDLAVLRPELEEAFFEMLPDPADAKERGVMARLYDQRMRLTAQNGLTDYDEGFLNFLWTFHHSEAATVDRAHAAI